MALLPSGLRRRLRREWYAAKRARAQAEVEAEVAIELPAEIQERAASLRFHASCLPFACTRSYRELNDEAAAIEEAARAAMALTQRGSFHVAR